MALRALGEFFLVCVCCSKDSDYAAFTSLRCSRYISSSSEEKQARNSGLAPLLISHIKSISSRLLILLSLTHN